MSHFSEAATTGWGDPYICRAASEKERRSSEKPLKDLDFFNINSIMYSVIISGFCPNDDSFSEGKSSYLTHDF